MRTTLHEIVQSIKSLLFNCLPAKAGNILRLYATRVKEVLTPQTSCLVVVTCYHKKLKSQILFVKVRKHLKEKISKINKIITLFTVC